MSEDSNDSKKKDSKANPEIPDFKGMLSDTVKKVFSAGVGAAFMSEEGIRNYLQDLKLPKEALNLVIQGATKSKDEITQRVTKEIVALVQKIDIVGEVSKFAETHTFKISAEIDIKKKDSVKEK